MINSIEVCFFSRVFASLKKVVRNHIVYSNHQIRNTSIRSHPRIAWEGLELRFYFHGNLRGATNATMLVIGGSPWVIRKTMVWAIKVIGRGVVNDVFAKRSLYRENIKEI